MRDRGDVFCFFFQAEDGIRDRLVTGVQTCALPVLVPLAVGLGLFQVGEFSFVLAQVGVSTNSISHEVYSLVLSTAIITMFLTPIISGQTAHLYALSKRW